MLNKKFLSLILVLTLSFKLSNCYTDNSEKSYDEQEQEYLDRRLDEFELFPKFTENLIIKTIFFEQSEEKIEDEEEYNANLLKLEEQLNRNQEKFIHTYVDPTETNTTSTPTYKNIDEQTSSPKYLFSKLREQYDSSFIFIEFSKSITKREADDLIEYVSTFTTIPVDSFKDLSINHNLMLFKLDNQKFNTTYLIDNILKYQLRILKQKGLEIVNCGIAKENHDIEIERNDAQESDGETLKIFGIAVFIGSTFLIILALGTYIIKKKVHFVDGSTVVEKKGLDDEEHLFKVNKNSTKKKQWKRFVPFAKETKIESKDQTPTQDYQELCRQRMQSKISPLNSSICTTVSNVHDANETPGLASPAVGVNSSTINSTPIRISSDGKCPDSRNSSWIEESMHTVNIDITTGHVILAYMEKVLNDKDLLNKDWKYLAEYQPDSISTEIASLPINLKKNRYENVLPYDHNLVKLKELKNNGYINASYIIDDDPKNPAYIATQSPLQDTAIDFWQMVWENQSVVIVNLSYKYESECQKCFQYWPEKDFETYSKFEVHLTSEHKWSEDFVVRNFFFKNKETDQTRTITQFQYLAWPETDVPSVKSILDFRKKVNKSYKSKTTPIIVHCNDGTGRTGTYIMIDMVLNKISKGAKEIDLAATLEFLRDQRPEMIKFKCQYEFSFEVITEEVKNILNALKN